MQLRPYQKEAIAAIQKHFNDGELRTLLVMATGCGKTVVFTSIAQSVVKKGGRVLILAHREELLTQAQDKLQKFWGIHGAIEKAEQTAVGTVFASGEIRQIASVEKRQFGSAEIRQFESIEKSQS